MASKWPARIAGGAAGLANGLFGGGGGMVFLPILSRWGNLNSRQLYATCVAVIFPVCAVSAAIYLWRGGMNWASALPYLATVVVLVVISRNPRTLQLNHPGSLGKPFIPGQ